jgi:RIP metalloprotease RseP
VIAAINDKEVMQLQHLQMLVNAKLGQSIKLQVQEGIPNPFPRPDQSGFDYINTFKEVTIVPRWKPPRKLVVSDVEKKQTEIDVKQARIFDPLAGVNDGLQVVPTITNRLFEISLKEARLIDPSIEIGDKISITPTGGEDRSISVIESRLHHPLLGSNTYIQEGAMGVHISLINPQYKKNTPNFFDAATSGWRQVLEILVTTKNAIKSAIIGSTNPQFEGPAAVGPIGIGQLTGEVALSDANTLGKITTLLSITATISLSLGIINLLPIPALDGGRIFFVLIEIIRGGRRISPNKEGLIHLIGFGILIGLVALVSIQDVVRIWNGESFF